MVGYLRAAARGQTLAELALVLPLFLVVVIGLFDIGRLVIYNSTLSNATREAVRLAIVDQTVPNIQQRARDEASAVLDLPTANVQIRFLAPDLSETGPCATAPYEIGCIAEVMVTYTFTPVVPFVGQVTLDAITQQPIERSYPSP